MALQLVYVYLIYLLLYSKIVYIYNLLILLIIFWYIIFISYLDNDFFSAFILGVEVLTFLIIIVFSFFNGAWLQEFKPSNPMLVVSCCASLLFATSENCMLALDVEFLDIDYLSDYVISDLRLLYTLLYVKNVQIILILVYFLFTVGLLILFLIKFTTVRAFNLTRINKFQNNVKQSWRLGSARIMK